jgi:hypothetical protein
MTWGYFIIGWIPFLIILFLLYMIKKRINSKEIAEKIPEIMESGVFMSISQIKKELEREFGVRINPQIVKGYLLKLEKAGKITRMYHLR